MTSTAITSFPTAPRLVSLPGPATDPVALFVLALPHTVSEDWLRDLVGQGLAAAPPTGPPGHRSDTGQSLGIGDIHMDLDQLAVRVGTRVLDLTHQEFLLLRVLLQHPGRVFSRRQLLDQAWNYPVYAEGGTGRTVDVHVRRLRVKLGAEARRIVTVRGFGYRLDAGA